MGAGAAHRGGVGFPPQWKQLCRHAQNIGGGQAAVGRAYFGVTDNLGRVEGIQL